MAMSLSACRKATSPKNAQGCMAIAAQLSSARRRLALAGLEPAVRLVDHVDATLAAHDAVVAVATAKRFQRVADFHGTVPFKAID
jgi:hypothetical protein